MKSRTLVFEWAFKVVVVVGLSWLIVLQFNSGRKDGIAYVDAMKILREYKGLKSIQRDFKKKTEGWNTNLDSLKTELEQDIKDYQATQSRLSKKERGDREVSIQKKENQFLNYQKVITEKIQSEDKELTGQVLKKIDAYIKKYGESHNYEIIFAATQYGNIVYSKKNKNITDEVLEGLNKGYAN
jgi:Skp family chaperone for outer membrane proteins